MPRTATKIEPLIWLLLVGAMAASFFVFSPPFSLGILLGSIIGSINVLLLKRNLENFFRQERPKKFAVISQFYLRFAVTALVLYFIVASGIAHVVGLLLGLALPANILLGTVIWRRRELFGAVSKTEPPQSKTTVPQ
jgi:hypothetical protein